MTHELTVWLFAERIGALSLVQGRLSFRYSTEWLVQPQARALSVSLPLQAEPFNDQQTRPFFAGTNELNAPAAARSPQAAGTHCRRPDSGRETMRTAGCCRCPR
ncbi:MAG: HipA N-terminal domain-containing protein [Burkholderiales bacterium]